MTLLKKIFATTACATVLVAGAAFAESYKIEGDTIQESLTGTPGDAARGRSLLINKSKGNCLACHSGSALSDVPFHGEVGPNFDEVGSRLSEGQLRLLLVDSKKVYPETVMPAFFKSEGFNRVGKKYEGKSILQAQEVEDIVAYLMTLK